MYDYNNLAKQAYQRQAELLKQAEARNLVTIAHGERRRFRFIGWHLPTLLLSLFNRKPASPRTTTRRTAADNI